MHHSDRPFPIGSAVVTPTFGSGTIQRPAWAMPYHELVLFSSGQLWWVPRRSLTPIDNNKVAIAKKTSAKRAISASKQQIPRAPVQTELPFVSDF